MTSVRASLMACTFFCLCLIPVAAFADAYDDMYEAKSDAGEMAGEAADSKDLADTAKSAATDAYNAATFAMTFMPAPGMRNANQELAAACYSTGQDKNTAGFSRWNNGGNWVSHGNSDYNEAMGWEYGSTHGGRYGIYNSLQCAVYAKDYYESATGDYITAKNYYTDSTNDNAVYYYGLAEVNFDLVVAIYNSGTWDGP